MININDFVSQELHLGNQISQALHNNKQTDFAYLLSLMSQDVTQMTSFQVGYDLSPQKERLRDFLEVKAPSALWRTFPEITPRDCHTGFHEGGLVQVRLLDAMQPPPIHYDSVPGADLLEVMQATSPASSTVFGSRDILKSPFDMSFPEAIEQQRQMRQHFH